MNNFNTPILFLIFNREDTAQVVFNAIRKVKPRQLFFAADGPRIGREGEKHKCEQTRNIINQVDWDCEVKTLFREDNLGCGRAVSEAITWFFDNVEEGIILEDDCLPADSFFYFCQIMLDKYRYDNRIGMITGTNYLFGYNDFKYSYYFSKHCYVWGWATWKRSWNLYDFYIKNFPDKYYLANYFGNKLSSDYYLEHFNEFTNGKMDTWDIQWSATLIKNNLYSIIPLNNQISNIGYLGTHTSKNVPISMNMPTRNIDFIDFKINTTTYEDELDLISMKNIVYKVTKKPLYKKILLKILGRKNINLIKKNISKIKIYGYKK